MTSRPPFSLLSDEILSRIRMHVGHDLQAHIALSQTCRRLRKLYEQDDRVWQTACFQAGFGRPLRRGNSTSHLSWRRIAHLLVNHASRCEIKSCRTAHLCFVEYYSAFPRVSLRDPLPPQSEIVLHPLYFYLHFAQTPVPGTPQSRLPCPDTLSILLTHLPTFPECKKSQYGPLCLHPNASCVFATFPPMESLSFQDADGSIFLTVENPDGCTILDVNRALAELIPEDVAPQEAALSHYRELMQTSGLSSVQFADQVMQDRGFLDDHEYPYLQDLVAFA